MNMGRSTLHLPIGSMRMGIAGVAMKQLYDLKPKLGSCFSERRIISTHSLIRHWCDRMWQQSLHTVNVHLKPGWQDSLLQQRHRPLQHQCPVCRPASEVATCSYFRSTGVVEDILSERSMALAMSAYSTRQLHECRVAPGRSLRDILGLSLR